MPKLLALTFATLMTLGLLSGCNTMEGAGEDIESGGESMQDQAS